MSEPRDDEQRPAAADMKVAAASPSFCEHPVLREELLRRFPDAKLNMALRPLDGAALIDFLSGYDVAIIGLERMSAEVIDALPDLKIISKLGTGVDMLDAEAMARRGIRLGWKAGANALSIAELVIGFAIIALRGMGALNQALRGRRRADEQDGPAPHGPGLRPARLRAYRPGGRALLKPFGCAVIAHDVADRSAFYAEHGVLAVSFEELLRRAEVLSLHIPLTGATRGLYGGETLDRLRADCILINTARGGIVDEDALYARLADGRLLAACSDVFASEPRIASPLIQLPSFFATPHIGGSAAEARLAMGRIAIDGIFDNFLAVPGVPPFV